jgi:RHS repeat-associated protein
MLFAPPKENEKPGAKNGRVQAPSVSLPKGGGAIRGMGEKFAANPVTGTGSMSVPIAMSPARSGFGPQLSLSYDPGSGNGPFGFGWTLSVPAITRKTDKGLPQYRDADESDVYILSGAEDLVPVLKPDRTRFKDDTTAPGFVIHRYRPRIEGLFARIERWTNVATGEIHWRSITRDNVTTLYGRDNNSRVFDPGDLDPAHPTRIFSWLICQSYDDKGNAVVYKYAQENDQNVDLAQANERNRVRTANRHLKLIKYGNRTPNRDAITWQPADPTQLPDDTWMFEVVFDYGEGHYAEDLPDDQQRIFAQAQIDPPAGSPWLVRQDPFSTYRPGFEVRTYRLCRRVLMFHHFPEELGIHDCLVRSTEFAYSESPVASFITSVTQSGYVRQLAPNQPNRYLKKSLPPLAFEYSQVPSPQELAQQPIRAVDAGSLENLPVGLDGVSYQWMDLDGEGTSGILTEQADGWYYKRNLSANNLVSDDGHPHAVARLGATEVVARKPAVGLADGGQFLDLAGDGQLDLVQMESSVRGFYERTDDANWAPFRPFVSSPDLNVRDVDLRFVDLTGDSHPDMLITEGEVLTWYPSLAQAGFGPAVRVSLTSDEEKGPRLVFADGTQSVYLADLSGDGLSDLVRIRNGEVCYWPNLGYGRFGAKVTMDNAPWFDNSDQFDQRRVRLADTDGSGTTDILYLRRDGVHIYFNQSGNRWSDAVPLPQFPAIDNISSVHAVDLLGNGTACLVWSSPLPGAARQPMRYLALMDEKPHLLVAVKNNLGAETKVHYAPSTKFYLDDKRAGKPWITRLPFPVHVVERVETYDHISRNYFVTRYAYHHGYFDHVEREFRGFGMVEQTDTEEFAALTEGGTLLEATNLEAASHVPPVLTKTWFHTGAYVGHDHVSDFFAGFVDADDHGEYYREPGLTDALRLPDSVLPAELMPEELGEASRALKGSMLRQETYALDGTEKAAHPYIIAEQNFTVERLQPRDGNRHTVFFTHAREALTYRYERNPADPRIQHALTLEVDDFGNVLKSAAVGYGRREIVRVINEQGEVTEVPNPDLNKLDPRDQQKQTEPLVTYTESSVTNALAVADDYRTPLPAETRTYELTGHTPTGPRGRFQASDFVKPDPNDSQHLIQVFDNEIQYEQQPTSGKERRLIEQVRTLYRKYDLTALLPLGGLEPLALPGESYKLAFTPGLLAQVFQRNGQALLPNPADVLGGQGADRGGYVDLDNDGHWWIPLGRTFLSPNPDDTAGQELAYARQHFYLPHRYRDPFHTSAVRTESIVTYDGHNLLMVETHDPLINIVTVETQDDNGNTAIRNDYRVLQPYWVTDPNGNRVQAEFDALGMVVATAVMGKPGEGKGDNLADFEADLTQPRIDGFHDALDPHALAADLLKSASTRIIYDLHRFRLSQKAHPGDASQWEAPYAATLARETHASDPLPPQGMKIQIRFSYSDGFGREIQKKIQAESGPVPTRDANGKIIVGPDGLAVMTSNNHGPRWVGSGWTILNNKGKPVRQYEPFFTDTHSFEFDVRIGVSPVLFYDPIERVVATLQANHTWEKVVFDPWRQETWDVNDTVLVADPKADADVGDLFGRLPDADYLPTWNALRTDATYTSMFIARYPDADVRTNETQAAEKAALHAGTPSLAHADSLGRTFLAVAHNRFARNGTMLEEKYATRVELDIEGNQRIVRDAIVQNGDALGRIVMRYDYDMLSNRIHQASMEAGERWMLNDVAGKPLFAWDSRDHQFRTIYDQLRRPTESYLREGAGPKLMVGRTVYGEGQPNHPEAKNQRGKIVQVFDQAGVVTSDDYDFKGNLLSSRCQLASEYKATLDWLAGPEMEQETFASNTSYDALNRPISVITPDESVYRPTFNEANLLETVDVNLRGAATATPFVTNIDYNAKGQRALIQYGNNVKTEYKYDLLTFRLSNLQTTRLTDRARLQDLSYTYDPIGNITHIHDGAQQTIYFNNDVVTPDNDYIYDAVYRLIHAEGREHPGQLSQPQTSWDDQFRVHLPHPGDGQVVRRYTEEYEYDAVGSFSRLTHIAPNGNTNGNTNGNWSRGYSYNEPSLLESTKKSNRLSSTTVGGNNPVTEPYAYDAHGNMTAMLHLTLMQWDFRDQLQATSRQVVNNGTLETTYYVYDGAGQRIRKVTERQTGTRKEERIYLGGFEIYREYENDGDTVKLERETLHVMDDKQRIALVETRTKGDDGSPAQLIRYQLGNHLGSASLELDDQAQIISYEEYYPYGSTSYQAVRSLTETPKRYRYSGMERDEETGLEYHSARYYAPWLGSWTNCDPVTVKAGVNLYRFCHNRPTVLVDVNGEDVSIGEAGDLPETATYEDLKKYARSHGKDYSDPNNERHYVMTEKGGQWKGGILKPHVYDPSEESERGFGNEPVDISFDTGTVPTGRYKTDSHSGDDYDVSAPKTAKRSGRAKGGGAGLPSRGKESSHAPTDAPVVQTPNPAPGENGYGSVSGPPKEGSGGPSENGWLRLPRVLVSILEAAVVVLAVVSIVSAIYAAATAFASTFSFSVLGLRAATYAAATELSPLVAGMAGISVSDRLSAARRAARASAIKDALESLRAGNPTPQALHLAERLEAVYGREALVKFMETGKLPKGVEFSHLFSAAEYPEFAQQGELGVLTDAAEHRLGHHAGDTRVPLHGYPRGR